MFEEYGRIRRQLEWGERLECEEEQNKKQKGREFPLWLPISQTQSQVLRYQTIPLGSLCAENRLCLLHLIHLFVSLPQSVLCICKNEANRARLPSQSLSRTFLCLMLSGSSPALPTPFLCSLLMASFVWFSPFSLVLEHAVDLGKYSYAWSFRHLSSSNFIWLLYQHGLKEEQEVSEPVLASSILTQPCPCSCPCW